jgi:ABC-2 type transport system ATP-binding protein
MKAIITLKELSKYYGSLLAVNNISMEVKEGEIFGFLGPNGAGKTTTIRMLVGLTIPSKGTATINGYDIRKEIVHVKQCVGLVPEASNLYNELSIWENLSFMAGMYHVPKNERKERIERLLKTFGLTDRKGSKFGKLSKGLKRRATIAAALIHEPRVLFLDEPTSGLDVMSSRSLRQFLRDLRGMGVTVFLTTHYIEEADQLCDRIAIIVKGQIVAIDTPENLKAAGHGRSILKVGFTSPVEAINLENLKKYGQIEVKDNTLWMYVNKVSEPLKALNRFIDDNGLEVLYMNTVKPSLEEAFVKLTGVEPEVMLMEKEGRGRRV